MDYKRDPNRTLIIGLGTYEDKFNQNYDFDDEDEYDYSYYCDVYFQITDDLADAIWVDDDDADERGWGPIGSEHLDKFIKTQLANGFTIMQGDTFKLCWSLGCLSSSGITQYYWTGTEVSAFDLAYDIGTIAVPCEISFPNYPIDYLLCAIGSNFRISPELEKQVVNNALYGIPPLKFKKIIKDKIVYSWFEYNNKKYWVIGIQGNRCHKTCDQLMTEFKEDYHNYTMISGNDNPYELTDDTMLIFKDTGY